MRRFIISMLLFSGTISFTGGMALADISITRYAQNSIVLKDSRGGIVLVDPGAYNYGPGLIERDFIKNVHCLIITHHHTDHFDMEAVKSIVKTNPGVAIWTTTEVVKALAQEGIHATLMEPGMKGSWAGGKFTAMRADHVIGDENITCFGVLIETEGKSLYITSDTMYFNPVTLGLKKKVIDCLILPFTNRGVTMGMEEAVEFAKGISPKLVIPCHYDSPRDKGRIDPKDFVNKLKSAGLNGQVVDFAQTFKL